MIYFAFILVMSTDIIQVLMLFILHWRSILYNYRYQVLLISLSIHKVNLCYNLINIIIIEFLQRRTEFFSPGYF